MAFQFRSGGWSTSSTPNVLGSNAIPKYLKVRVPTEKPDGDSWGSDHMPGSHHLNFAPSSSELEEANRNLYRRLRRRREDELCDFFARFELFGAAPRRVEGDASYNYDRREEMIHWEQFELNTNFEHEMQSLRPLKFTRFNSITQQACPLCEMMRNIMRELDEKREKGSACASKEAFEEGDRVLRIDDISRVRIFPSLGWIRLLRSV